MLIPFPIAFFVATLLCDLMFWGTHYAIWTTAALWLLGAGIIMAALAATAGLTDFVGDRRIRNLNDAWYHAIGNATALLIQLFSFYERYRYGTSAVLSIGLICSAVVVCILLFTAGRAGRWSTAIALPSTTSRSLLPLSHRRRPRAKLPDLNKLPHIQAS